MGNKEAAFGEVAAARKIDEAIPGQPWKDPMFVCAESGTAAPNAQLEGTDT